MSERILPHSIEAERGVLGSIVIDPEAYDLIAVSLRADDFYRNGHRVIYAAIVSLVAKRINPDYLTLCNELEQSDKLEEAGGASYITGLINDVPTSGNIEYYARIVSKSAEDRGLISYAGHVVVLAYARDPQAMQKSEQMLFNLQRHTLNQGFTDMPEMV